MEDIIRARLKLIQGSVVSLVSAARETISRLSENKITIEESEVVSVKLKTINERFISEMYNYYKIIQNPCADEASQYTMLQMEAEELIAELSVKIRVKRSDFGASRSNVDSSNVTLTSKLPRMELAKFNGDVLKWYQFWDQFVSNIDSRNISDVDKLLYLQSVLEGEAKQAIEGLDITSKNYNIAVETLKKRYGKPGAVIDAHYVALYRIKTAGKSVKDNRNVLNQIDRHLRVLKSLGEDVNHNHLRVMIMEKFPEDLIYELRMKITTEEETIDNIRNHLEHIISARETSLRMKKETLDQEENLNKGPERFSIETLHIKSEKKEEKGRFQNKGSNKFFRDDRNGNNDNRKQADNKGNYKKKQFKERDNEGEPKTKRRKISCIFCEQDHFNDECLKYKTIQDRKRKLRGRCFNCFGSSHRFRDCRSKRKCHHCGKFGEHNRALCPDNAVVKKIKTGILHAASKGDTILQTSVVTLQGIGNRNKRLTCRVLLDCGSQRSYITTKVAKELDLPIIEQSSLSIFTFGAKKPQEVESPIVCFEMVTRTDKCTSIHANVIPHITTSVPCPNKAMRSLVSDGLLVMADDGSLNDQVDVLLGNDYYYSFMYNEKIEKEKGLFLVNSDFGWVWSGKSRRDPLHNEQLSVLTYFQSCIEGSSKLTEPDLPLRSDSLKMLWELESIGITDSPKATRDEEAIKFFNETTNYVDNRYQVKWPWTEYPPALPVNLGLAYGRLVNLVKRLDSNALSSYAKVLTEQLNQGIIEIVDIKQDCSDHPVHYLPHHGVYQPGKPIRIVYDASSKVKDNKSLNECLYCGPLMLEDLTGLLIRFRTHRIGIIADVEKAFLQIGLQQPDRDVTRFLWIKDPTRDIDCMNLIHLRFCRVPFGIISSPFLLNATIRCHLSKSNNEINKRIANDIYVDNLVTGSESIQDATKLYESAKGSFNEISMNLREWNSNSEEFKNNLPQIDREKEGKVVKVLGLNWNLKDDTLHLRRNYETESFGKICTKREVLKVIASIYDPCGFIIPVLLPAKLFLQDLWKLKLKWDSRLSEDLHARWKSIASNFDTIKDVKVPRFYASMLPTAPTKTKQVKYELHCFTDASIQAYAAALYLRCTESDQTSVVNFIIGKSRLVPIKDQDDLKIPRLELLGVLIGSRLISYALKFLTLQIERQVIWTDSQIVISWCNSNKLLPPFIARRVDEIKQNKNVCVRYVPTDINPADVATRSNSSNAGNQRWLSGPDFLLHNQIKWPVTSLTNVEDVQLPTFLPIEEDLPNSESPTQINDTHQEENNKPENPGTTHTKNNEKDIIKEIQKKYFKKEFEGKNTDLTRSLGIYKDSEGLLRCRGRYQNSNWPDEQKEPTLLPKNAEYTLKLIEDIHTKNYHVGVSHTLALLRKKYWVPHGRSQVQKVLRKCQQCRKYGGGPYKLPQMPPLPAERANYSAPFMYTGLDYFGPLMVDNGSQPEKRWVCLYTCLAVRAIHMEVVKDLSAEECLLALRRFIAVRGLPHLIISDNASQFKLSSDVLCNKYCIDNNIKWQFIPELAPWCGGFYERLIGIVKHCLKRTMEKHLVNNNKLCTIIKEVEAIVNTRPLTTVGEDLEHVLTPSDFLHVGGPLLTETSDTEFVEPATVTKTNLIDGWKYGQMILEEYAKMFTNQYLTSLRNRKSSHNQPRVLVDAIPNIGDIVQIKGDLNRAHWKVCKITNLINSSDGLVRVAKVLTPKGELLTRSISHLYPLEFNEEKVAPLQHSVPDIHNDNNAQVDSRSVRDAQASTTPEPVPQPSGSRPTRISARSAREKIKKWTAQLFSQ